MINQAQTREHKALCALTGLCGLRVHEALTVTDSDLDTNSMILRVRGKGDKERYVPVSTVAWTAIALRWSEVARAGGGCLVALNERSARDVITRIGRRCHLSRPISSHDMRATFATAAYASTKDLRAVQEILGHADPATTQIYTQVHLEAMRSAVESI